MNEKRSKDGIDLFSQSTEAVRNCEAGQVGFVRHKCNPTNDDTRGYWATVTNSSDCVQKNLSVAEKHVREH